MKCTNADCRCLTHVSPETHLPCCPHCKVPLLQTDPDPFAGDCPNGRWVQKGRGRCPALGRVFTHDTWQWLPRDNFHGEDLPPSNGWRPIQIDEAWL